MLSLFQKNIQNLPQELQNHIISYTYSPQPKFLLEDIQNFTETKEYLYEIIDEMEYQNNFYFISAKDDLHNELCNFIYYYLCDGTLEMIHTYFWRRYFMYGINISQNMSQIIIDKLSIYPIDSQINIIWGLLVKEERYSFLDFYTSEYEEDQYDAVEEDYDF
jgi:hypothetical protein